MGLKESINSLRTLPFFETISINKHNIPGWGWSSQADYWSFVLLTQEILVIEPRKFRTLVWELRFQIPEKKVPDLDYNTWGVLVPLERVKEISCYQKKLSAIAVLFEPQQD